MKIECSRQLSDGQTDGQRLPLTGLLSEPKNIKYFTVASLEYGLR